VQAVAECLAGVVYVNAIAPGHPAVFGTWPFVSDLRTGAMSGGSGEQALLSAGCAQMHRFYDLPGGAAAGIADSKLPDMQAGWEQAISNTMAG
jgi:trimethylamine--corrinoid protein Co-methyltransferase